MGYPSSGTVEIPDQHPHLVSSVERALADPDGVRTELLSGLHRGSARPGHLCVAAWVFTPELDRVVLVEHPRLGWTIPGGHLDPGEAPLDGACRELHEETGLLVTSALEEALSLAATAIPPSAEHPEHVHYCLSYGFTADRYSPLVAEVGQPARWFDLADELPEGFFRENWRARAHALTLRELAV